MFEVWLLKLLWKSGKIRKIDLKYYAFRINFLNLIYSHKNTPFQYSIALIIFDTSL